MAFDSQPPTTQENRERLKSLFVDVGCNNYPVIRYGNRKFEENETYLGLDLSGVIIDKLAEQYKGSSNIQFKKVPGDQDNFYFPVPDSTASEVHIANVFGIPGAVDTHNLHLLLEESIRILKVGGTLSVLETLTPNYKREYFENLLRLFHLKITLSISPDSPEWEENVAEYSGYSSGKSTIYGDQYYLIKAEKSSAEKIS